MIEHLPILIILGPLLGAVFASLTSWYRPKLSFPVVIFGLAISSLSAILIVFKLAFSELDVIHYQLGGWGTPEKDEYGIVGIQISVDYLNGLILATVSTIGLLTAVFSTRSVERELTGQQRYFFSLFSLLVSGLLGISITGDIFNLYVFMEIAALSSYALIAYGKGRSYMASFNYLMMGTMGACLYLLGVGFVFVKTGTLNIENLSQIIPQTLQNSQAVFVGFVLIMIGAWAKMAFFPLHGWLPNAYSYAPTASGALLAPLATKVSVYAMLRIMITVYSIDYVLKSPSIQSTVLLLSTISILVGSFFSITQSNLRKIACYFIISEIGYMVGGAWLANEPGLKGAIYHVVADAAMTSAFFMIIGCIVYRTGQTELKKLDGLFYKMPLTFVALIITMAALIGVPPTCGFFSKFYLIQGAVQAGTWHFVIALLISSLIKAIILFRIIEICYNKVPNPAKEGNKTITREEAPLSMLIPTLIVTLSLIVIGLFTDKLVTNFIAKALPEIPSL
jgi:multicomponent Na+:H+ antiporter subunit D